MGSIRILEVAGALSIVLVAGVACSKAKGEDDAGFALVTVSKQVRGELRLPEPFAPCEGNHEYDCWVAPTGSGDHWMVTVSSTVLPTTSKETALKNVSSFAGRQPIEAKIEQLGEDDFLVPVGLAKDAIVANGYHRLHKNAVVVCHGSETPSKCEKVARSFKLAP